jgi:hypothetical protein
MPKTMVKDIKNAGHGALPPILAKRQSHNPKARKRAAQVSPSKVISAVPPSSKRVNPTNWQQQASLGIDGANF